MIGIIDQHDKASTNNDGRLVDQLKSSLLSPFKFTDVILGPLRGNHLDLANFSSLSNSSENDVNMSDSALYFRGQLHFLRFLVSVVFDFISGLIACLLKFLKSFLPFLQDFFQDFCAKYIDRKDEARTTAPYSQIPPKFGAAGD